MRPGRPHGPGPRPFRSRSLLRAKRRAGALRHTTRRFLKITNPCRERASARWTSFRVRKNRSPSIRPRHRAMRMHRAGWNSSTASIGSTSRRPAPNARRLSSARRRSSKRSAAPRGRFNWPMLSADISRWRIGSLFRDFACATPCVPRGCEPRRHRRVCTAVNSA
jgi:hypothetical protein